MLVAMSLVGSVAVFADDTTTNTTAPTGGRMGGWHRGGEGSNGAGGGNGISAGDICARISDMASQAEGKLGQIKTPGDRLANWEAKKTEQNAKLTALRAQWNANRDAQFKKLEERAGTDSQKIAAVSAFEATVRSAISTREATVDVARTTFQTGVEGLINTHSQGVSGDKTAFEVAIKAAFDAAQADCGSSGANAATIRTTLRTALAAARSKFQADKQSVPKVGTDIQVFITARKTAIDKAMVDFKATMETARIALKKAFPNDGATPVGTTNPVPVQ